jgi:vacuolar-type H+-ATPase subunit H
MASTNQDPIINHDPSEIVEVPIERYSELEKLEISLPGLIEEAIKEYKRNSLKRLHERDKENPESVKKRVQRYIEKNREKINERRREKRKEQKRVLDANQRQTTSAMIIDMFNSSGQENFKTVQAKPVKALISNNGPYILSNDITVRFDD